ncbi:uncharacterized protein I206_101470 [Kwoniella pini CBS 10737]|uniref:Protein CPL1-like domain-containing protein n=1 Tax=Kwoniella pini CBS 10737 TaxID=1296096 RepID=A0A1B9HWK5_9TREE|nr:uncharacterized protein I206_06558 [Kwoniella pini CBS 10737]OCF47653.1 hypothetical protein I206_06558 [Kwoniella pini CBS 10737]
MLPRMMFVLTTLTLLSLTQAATFVGCVLSLTVSLTAQNGARVSNQNACNTRCIATKFQYSYFTANTLLGTINCYCDNVGTYVASSSYLVGSSSDPSSCLDTSQATATDLRTTFNFEGCSDTLTGVTIDVAQGTILGGAIVQDPHACFQRCAGNGNAYFIPIAPSITALLPTYGCVCDYSGSGTAGTCGILEFYRYTHSATASQNAQARKREVESLAVKESGKSFCPKQMISCRVPGVEDSWECVDPQADLESCGGCTSGEYKDSGFINFTATGQDCTDMPGVLMGGSTCTNGDCVAFACKRKWTLRDGRCVRGRS